MQSGITASAELQKAFTTFTSDTTQFCLPVSISSEALTPLPTIAFASSSSTFSASLSSLDSLLTPTAPLYLLLRTAPAKLELIAATYIPSRAPVRQKTLFASTRSTLVRELGGDKFVQTVFRTEREEILDPAQWEDEVGGAPTSGGQRSGEAGVDIGLLSVEERELQAVKRAEEEERHGTRGRDLMNDGGSGTGGYIGTRDGANAGRSGIQMRITDEARAALTDLSSTSTAGPGMLVQFGIEIATETLTLLSSKPDVAADAVVRSIPADQPSYSFYTVAAASSTAGGVGTIFIYACPGASKVKERMIYASSRRGVLHVAEGEGVKVLRRLEAGDPDELGVGRVEDEVKSLTGASGGAGGVRADGVDDDSAPGSGTATPRGGFARPKRPGKR